MRTKMPAARPLGDDTRLTLFASRGIDPTVVDAIDTLWRRARSQMRGGETIHVPGGGPPDAPVKRDPAGGLAVLPVFDGEELLALLYLDGVGSASRQEEMDRLARFSRTLAQSVAVGERGAAAATSGLDSYLERTPVQDIHRQKLLLLLERHRWNISRVARLMGVTRRTIYMRLRRYEIPRKRVARARIRRVAS